MTISILLLILGLALIVFGADWLVDGASTIARKAGLSEFVIGLTIVGMGTSAPEMVVSFTGAAVGSSDIAIGNILGSNIFNTLLILGLTAIILPMSVTRDNKRKDIPINILITLLLIVLSLNKKIFGIGEEDTLGRIDGGILVAFFITYMIFAFIDGKKQGATEAQAPAPEKSKSLLLSILLVLLGLGGLIVGGRLFVDSATKIAHGLGVSDKFIAITVLAGGTSLPELATCVVAAAKKKGQLALGNILGSNIFNILLILGGSALISPISMASITNWDWGFLFLSSVLILTGTVTGEKDKIDRADGFVMVLLEMFYLFILFRQL